MEKDLPMSASFTRSAKPPIYVIERLWIDTLENNPGEAVGYKPIGFTEDEFQANEICKKSGVFAGRFWAITTPIPVLRKVTINHIDHGALES